MKKSNGKPTAQPSGKSYTCFPRTPATEAILDRVIQIPELEISGYGDLSTEPLIVQYTNLNCSLHQLYDYVSTLIKVLVERNYLVDCREATDADAVEPPKLLPRQALRYTMCRNIKSLFTIPYDVVVYAPCDKSYCVDPAHDTCLFCDTLGEPSSPESVVAHEFAVRAHQFIIRHLLMTGVLTPQQVHYCEVVLRGIATETNLIPARNMLCAEKMVNFVTALCCYAQAALAEEFDAPLNFDPTYFCADHFVQHMYELAESV